MKSHTVGHQGERKEGDQLNLERAMGAHVRFGGHFVQVRDLLALLSGIHCSRRTWTAQRK